MVTIIILNWNGLKDTIDCIESIKVNTYPEYCIVVVDNGSKGVDAQVLCERYNDSIKVICNEKNLGFSGGMNAGINYALKELKQHYILLLNNDTIVDPDFLNQLISVADEDPTIGITGPKVYYFNEPTHIQEAGNLINMYRGQIRTAGHFGSDEETVKQVDYFGPCILIRNEVIHKIGILDEDYFCYWEDADYGIRTKKAGYKVVYVPKSKIWHKVEKSTQGKTGFVEYYISRNRFRFMKKNATRAQYICFLIIFFCFDVWLITGSRIYRKQLRQLPYFYRGIVDGLLMSVTRARTNG
jgi:GT2 family glycosyltransferase